MYGLLPLSKSNVVPTMIKINRNLSIPIRSFGVSIIKLQENENGKEYFPLKEIPNGFGKTESMMKTNLEVVVDNVDDDNKNVEIKYDHKNDWWKIYTPRSTPIGDRNNWSEDADGIKLAKELLSLNPVDLPPLSDLEQRIVNEMSAYYPPANETMGVQEGHGVQYINTSISLIEHLNPKLIVRSATKDIIHQILYERGIDLNIVVTGNEGTGKSRMIELVLRELLLDNKMVLIQTEFQVYAFIPPISAFGQNEYKVYSVELKNFKEACALLHCENVFRLIDPKKVQYLPVRDKAIEIIFPVNDCEKWFQIFEMDQCMNVQLCGYTLSELYAVRSILDPEHLISEMEIKRRYMIIGGVVSFAYHPNLDLVSEREICIRNTFNSLNSRAIERLSGGNFNVGLIDSNQSSFYPAALVGIFRKFNSGKTELYSRLASFYLECWFPLAVKGELLGTFDGSFSSIAENHFAPYLIEKGFRVEFLDVHIEKRNIPPLKLVDLEGNDATQNLFTWFGLKCFDNLVAADNCYKPNQLKFLGIQYFLAKDCAIQVAVNKSHSIHVATLVKWLAGVNNIQIDIKQNMEDKEMDQALENAMLRLISLKEAVRKVYLILLLPPVLYINHSSQNIDWKGLFEDRDDVKSNFMNLVIQGKAQLIFPIQENFTPVD